MTVNARACADSCIGGARRVEDGLMKVFFCECGKSAVLD